MRIDIERTSLWSLGIAPLIWALHTLACYILASVWCAKFGRAADLTQVRFWIFVFTILAVIPVAFLMVRSHRLHRHEDSPPPHNEDTPEDRERFLGLANLLISGMSLIAILFIAFNAVIFRSCQ